MHNSFSPRCKQKFPYLNPNSRILPKSKSKIIYFRRQLQGISVNERSISLVDSASTRTRQTQPSATSPNYDCTIAHNGAQWPAQWQQVALNKNKPPATQKHGFLHCVHNAKNHCAPSKIPTQTLRKKSFEPPGAFRSMRSIANQWRNNCQKAALTQNKLLPPRKHSFPHCSSMPKPIDRNQKSYPKLISK